MTMADLFDEDSATLVSSKEASGSLSDPDGSARASTTIDLRETARGRQLAVVASIEDEILEKSAAVVRNAARFGEISPDLETVPDEWVREYGSASAAEEAFRIAKYALMPNKEAPVGLRMAQATFVGITKARAQVKAAPTNLNVAIVNLNAPAPPFPELELEGE